MGHPFFFNIKTLAHLAGSTTCRGQGKTIAFAISFTWARQRAGQRFPHINALKYNVDPLPWDTFLHTNGLLLNNFVLTCATFCNVCFHNTFQTQKRYPSGTVEDSRSHPEQCLRTEPSREISREHFHYLKSRICHD